MLVLSRSDEPKKDTILIGDDIVITVLSVRGNKVRLGLSVPKEITVLRQELLAEKTE